MIAKNYERQRAYRKRQISKGFVFLQTWARPHEAEMIRGMLKGWREAEARAADAKGKDAA